MNCIVCNANLTVTWCDTHGIAACLTCGMPYGIEGYSKRTSTVPAIEDQKFIEAGKAYWSERKRRVFPGWYDMGFVSGRSYSGASISDAEEFRDWLESNADKFGIEREASV